ncbi:MAG: carboxypeptidase regulatory-like domain-containing protein, partial [Candidatus Delongbacteria bacterium]|nr:carboxypeptidase regulatory-like domain-containing protein [Candidatus Delongbacteria bacterium]
WSWQVGNGANSSRNCQAEGVLAPLNADQLLWEGSTLFSYWPHQPFIQDSVMVTDRTFDMSDVLHGTAIVAYDLLTGDTLWTQDLPVIYPATDWRNRVCGVWEGVVYATRAGNTNASCLYALDLTDGTISWESEALTDMSSTECVAFAPNGDLLIGNFSSIARVSALDGTTVWDEVRYSPTSGGSEVACFENHVYGWEASGSGPKIVVHDLSTGAFLYESHGIGGGLVQQLGCFVGPDGIVYAPRTQNNTVTDSLAAFEDTGSALVELWHIHLAYVPFATFGVDLTGDVYSYTPDYRIIHIDSHSGDPLGRSVPIAVDLPVQRQLFQGGTLCAAAGENRVRISIPDYSTREPTVLDTSIIIADPDAGVVSPQAALDAEGYLYVTNHQAELFCFDSGLELIWQETFDRPDGPAIARDGQLVICADAYEMKVFAGRGVIELGTISGRVTLSGGNGDVSSAVVAAGGSETNPDLEGNYSLDVTAGTYQVSASLEGYLPGTVDEVVVEAGETTEDVDLLLLAETVVVGGTLFVGLEGGAPPTFHTDMDGFPDITWTGGFSFDVSGAAATPEGIIYLCEGAFTTNLYEATLETQPQQLCVIESDMSGLAYGRDQLWGYSNYAAPRGIYGIDPATGATELALDVGDYRFFALGYNPADDLFYGYTEYGATGLYAVDIDSGEMTQLAGAIPATNGQGRGLAVGDGVVYLTATRGDDDIPCFAYDLAQGAGGVWIGFPNPYPAFHSTGGAAWIPDVIEQIIPLKPEGSTGMPGRFTLSQNYPNPFNPTTTIEFTLNSTQEIELALFNLLGQKVALLAAGVYPAGIHRVVFDTSAAAGSPHHPLSALPSGVYLYRLTAADLVISRKMVLLR